MSKRHRRAIRLLNLTRQWCRQCERVIKKQPEAKGIPFRLRVADHLVREIRSR